MSIRLGILLKRLCASCIISCILISNTCTLYATETTIDEEIQNEEGVIEGVSCSVSDNTLEPIEKSLSEEEILEAVADSLSSSSSLNTQVDELYTLIADELGFDEMYIKELHLLAGGQVLYSDKKPNIYTDETVRDTKSALAIEGANTVWRKADFIECNNPEVVRPSEYFLPDAVYSVSYDVKCLFDERLTYNRGEYQIYFNSLNEKSKKDIAFYEAVLLYTGASEEVVNSFYTAYEKTLYDKQVNENVVEITTAGELQIKSKFVRNFKNIDITDKRQLGYLAILLSFDRVLAVNNNIENLKTAYILPYKTNYTSRENMMVASACLVGRVRYIWGGGHSGASYIDGINPVWSKWESLYPDTPTSEILNEETSLIEEVTNIGYNTCIKPSGSWCPIHGYSTTEYHGESVNSLDEYIELRKDIFETDELTRFKYREMLSRVDYSEGINVHTLDGLDCSGFASWLYNQITDKYEINSTAINFTKQKGLKSIEYGSTVYPGDIFAWTKHIVIIVGKVNDDAKAFVTVEQTPNVLKYGVIHYKDASQEDIDLAIQIASEANQLIGGLNAEFEQPHVYCMDSVGVFTTSTTETIVDITQEERKSYTTVDVFFPNETYDGYNPYDYVPSDFEYVEELPNENGVLMRYYTHSGYHTEDVYTEHSEVVEHKEQYREIGRFSDSFIDENTKIEDYNRPIKDMLAKDIIQHTLTKLPLSYVLGYDNYNGSIFNKDLVASNLGIEYVYEDGNYSTIIDKIPIKVVVDIHTDDVSDIEVHTDVDETNITDIIKDTETFNKENE